MNLNKVYASPNIQHTITDRHLVMVKWFHIHAWVCKPLGHVPWTILFLWPKYYYYYIQDIKADEIRKSFYTLPANYNMTLVFTNLSAQLEHVPDAMKCSVFLSSSKYLQHFQVERLPPNPPSIIRNDRVRKSKKLKAQNKQEWLADFIIFLVYRKTNQKKWHNRFSWLESKTRPNAL